MIRLRTTEQARDGSLEIRDRRTFPTLATALRSVMMHGWVPGNTSAGMTIIETTFESEDVP